MFLLLFSLSAFAASENTTYTIPMYRQSKSDTKHEIDLDCEGNRAPARPTYICLDKINGVYIPNIDKHSIESYDVYDSNGNIIGSFIEDVEFACFVLFISDLSDFKRIFQYYNLPNCPHCNNCKLERECRMSHVRKIQQNIKNIESHIDQNRIKDILENDDE